MRRILFATVSLILLAVVPVPAQDESGAVYRIKVEDEDVHATVNKSGDKQGLLVTLRFKVIHSDTGQLASDVSKDEIVVLEDDQEVDVIEIFRPRAHNLTTVLTLDVSGSMNSNNKIGQAKKAASLFVEKLNDRSDVGLILFNHEIPDNDPSRVRPPARNPSLYKDQQETIRRLINQAVAEGGTAYLDATAKAVELLKDVSGRKAILVMTDGVDGSSKKKLQEVIDLAIIAEVPVYTLGIGNVGGGERVTTALVLDKSGSMRGKANDTDTKTKMEALKEAATRFVELMRTNAYTTLIPFSNLIDKPKPFSDDKDSLKRQIGQLDSKGGTVLYDATLDGINTLIAGGLSGKKAVVVLTDGRDETPGSRHTPDYVIARAKEKKIPLYMLGLGRRREINEAVMKRMASETGGEYYHAESRDRLVTIFEQLSLKLHDDGIDEDSLRKLADETGGKYYHIDDISKLSLIYGELAEELTSTYTVTFKSTRQSHDGTARGIQVKIRRDGKYISAGGDVSYNVRGVVVPEMTPTIYLFLLGLILAFLALPTVLRSFNKSPA